MLTVRTFCACLLLLYSLNASAMDAQKYDARLCSAQLLVLNGDLQQLLDKSTSILHKQGYRQRIAGAMGTLKWLCRQYASFHELTPSETASQIDKLRTAIKNIATFARLQAEGHQQLLLSIDKKL